MSSKTEKIPVELVEGMAEALKAMAHPQRLRIIELLDIHGQMAVHEIVEQLDIPQASVSGHLTKLRHTGHVKAVRRGKEVYYGIANPHSLTILNCIRNRAAGC